MHELAFGLTSNNGRFGPARNPHDPARVSGGSSGGSAAAVAAGSVPFALSTDTGAWVTAPSGYCGVADVRTVNGVITRTAVRPAAAEPRGLTVGIPAKVLRRPGPGSEVASAVDQALDALRPEGVRFVETGVPDAMGLAAAGFSMVFYETPVNVRTYLNEAEEAYRGLTLAEIAARSASPDVTAMPRLMLDAPISPEHYERDGSATSCGASTSGRLR